MQYRVECNNIITCLKYTCISVTVTIVILRKIFILNKDNVSHHLVYSRLCVLLLVKLYRNILCLSRSVHMFNCQCSQFAVVINIICKLLFCYKPYITRFSLYITTSMTHVLEDISKQRSCLI